MPQNSFNSSNFCAENFLIFTENLFIFGKYTLHSFGSYWLHRFPSHFWSTTLPQGYIFGCPKANNSNSTGRWCGLLMEAPRKVVHHCRQLHRCLRSLHVSHCSNKLLWDIQWDFFLQKLTKILFERGKSINWWFLFKIQ